MKTWLRRGGLLLGLACLGAGCTATGGQKGSRQAGGPNPPASIDSERNPYYRDGGIQSTETSGPKAGGGN